MEEKALSLGFLFCLNPNGHGRHLLLYEEALQRLKDEVRRTETVERPKISKQIAEARDKGDLSENAEYDAAKEAQGLLEAKISKLKNTLANASSTIPKSTTPRCTSCRRSKSATRKTTPK